MKKIFIIFIIFFSYFINSIADERIKKLNQLFDDLKTQNYSAAYKVEQEIWQIWSTHPNDKNLTMLLNEGSRLVNESKYSQAIDIFSKAINLDPYGPRHGINEQLYFIYLVILKSRKKILIKF